jgi:hypothetical protein
MHVKIRVRYECYLFYLDALDSESALVVETIKEKEFASLHDWVVFLGDLVALR